MNKLLDFINLEKGEDEKQKVLENVRSNIFFTGANLWVLACAIVVASVGLNVNSTAVIIGAMLISPLMAPIWGAGFGLAMFDFDLLRKSLKSLFIATIVSLTVSTIYFILSPFKGTQTEILARTSPNIYDIFIAFFGGLVGAIAITRVEKGNPIPGVAIATALMPPLCTAGYGLAIGNWKFVLGALYLYMINCVFICIATFVIVKYLKYPRKKQVDRKHEQQVTLAMTLIILMMMVPSVYFAYLLLEEKKYNEKVDSYLQYEFINKGYTLVYHKTQYNTIPKKIELAFLKKKFSDSELKTLNNKLDAYGISNTQLQIKQDTADIKRDILNELGIEKNAISQRDAIIADLENEIQRNTYDNMALLAEIRILFPEVENISLSNHVFENRGNDQTIVVMIYQSKKEISDPKKLTLWLEKRLGKEKVEIYRKTT